MFCHRIRRFRNGPMRTGVARTLPLDEVPEALEPVQRREAMGRLVVER